MEFKNIITVNGVEVKLNYVSATDVLLGRVSALDGVIEEIPVSDFIQTLLNDADASTARNTLGLGTTATTDVDNYVTVVGDQDVAGIKNFSDDVVVGVIRARNSNGIRLENNAGDLGIYINDSGDIGIGTSDVEASTIHYGNIQLGLTSMILYGQTVQGSYYIDNAYYDGTWKRRTANPASFLAATYGQVSISVADTGLIDSSISWINALNVMSPYGYVGVGTNVPEAMTPSYDYTSSNVSLLQVGGKNYGRFVVRGSVNASLELVDTGAAVDAKWGVLTTEAGITKFLSMNDDGAAINNDNIISMDHLTGHIGIGVAPVNHIHVYHTRAVDVGTTVDMYGTYLGITGGGSPTVHTQTGLLVESYAGGSGVANVKEIGLHVVVRGAQTPDYPIAGLFQNGVVEITKSSASKVWSPVATVDNLIFENNGHNVMQIITSNTGIGAIGFSDTAERSDGAIVYNHSIRQLQLNSGALTRFTLDGATGNAGFHTTDIEASHANYKAINFGTRGYLMYAISGSGGVHLGDNLYYDGTWKYRTTDEATLYAMGSGSHSWYRSLSGSANAAITLVPVMTLDTTNKLSIAAGSGTDFANVGGTLASDITPSGTTGAGDTIMKSFSVPGNTLAVNGQALWFEASGTFANNANNKRVLARFGTAGSFSIGATALGYNNAACVWFVEGRVIRISATSQLGIFKGFVSMSSVGGFAETPLLYIWSLNQTLSNTLPLNILGTGNVANDVICTTFRVGWDNGT